MAVADPGHLGIEVGTHDEVGAVLDVQGRGRGIDDRTHAQHHFGALPGGELDDLDEHLRSEIAAVGELESAHAALVAGFHDLLGDLGVSVIEYGNHAGLTDGLQNLHFIEASHNF